jgi:radical SAM protein with 4Fe4S-binding SPASM domain
MNLDLHLTTSCNMKCKFCGAWEQELDSCMLDIKEVYHALNEGKKGGYKFITLTGGEPALHPDINTIIEYASQLGYWVCITTNGLHITEELIKTAKRTRCQLRISLHTLIREFHQQITGADTLNIIMNNIEKLKNNSIFYGIGMTVYEENVEEIEDLAEYAWRQKAAFVRYTPIVGVRQGHDLKINSGFYYKMLLCISKIAVNNLKLLNYRRNSNIGGNQMLDIMLTRQCAAGSRLFMILDAQKNLVPCSFIERELHFHESGFEKSDDFKKIYRRMDCVFEQAKEEGYRGKCSKCVFIDSCKGGCLVNKLSFGLNANDEQPICYRSIVYGVLSNFKEEEKTSLIEYWTYYYLQKCIGIEKDKLCFRRLPIWELNFKFTHAQSRNEFMKLK